MMGVEKGAMTLHSLLESLEDKFDEISHTLITDYAEKYGEGDYMDGYITALVWVCNMCAPDDEVSA